MKTIKFIINDDVVFEHDKDTAIPEEKAEFLNKMDKDMGKGLKINGELISKPNQEERSRFIVLNLIKAFQQDNHAIISASCAYLMSRIPGLHEVRISHLPENIDIDFVIEQ
ncbi:MAG: hypothetical protein OEY52_13155 [Gammaproteobacteria bacterium]|nr:hypothetical protein [Gammaproteobacteria bacterium]